MPSLNTYLKPVPSSTPHPLRLTQALSPTSSTCRFGQTMLLNQGGSSFPSADSKIQFREEDPEVPCRHGVHETFRPRVGGQSHDQEETRNTIPHLEHIGINFLVSLIAGMKPKMMPS